MFSRMERLVAEVNAAGRAIGMTAAAEAVGDAELARRLTHDAPAALLEGAPIPPRPERRRSIRLPWRR